MGTAEELAFLLQESGTTLVDASDVLHVVNKALAEKNRLMPRGMTEADAWMARHGNPLASTEAAIAVAGMAGKLLEMNTRVSVSNDFADVSLVYGTLNREASSITGRARCETLPIAICAATMDALHKKGSTHV